MNEEGKPESKAAIKQEQSDACIDSSEREQARPKVKDVELDMVAESLDHSTILIGECKWTTGENGRLLTNGISKIVPFLPFVNGKKVVIKLFTKVRPEEDQGNSLLPADVLRLL